MRMINFVLGCGVSVLVHFAVLAPALVADDEPVALREEPRASPPPIVVAQASTETEEPSLSAPEEADEAPPEESPPEPPPPPEPEPAPEPRVAAPEEPVVDEPSAPEPEEPAPAAEESEVEEAPQTVDPPLDLVQEHDGGIADTQASSVGEAGEAAEAPATPQLVLRWDGPEHLLAVAREHGLRVVALDGAGEIAGEVTRADGELRPFDSRVAAFSNRVRSLPTAFLPDVVTAEHAVREYWVLVPIAVDRRFSRLTLTAARNEGRAPEDVRAVHAHFAKGRTGDYSLRVHSVEVR